MSIKKISDTKVSDGVIKIPQYEGNDTLVIVESPYAGDIEANLEYARRCMSDCFKRGEVPFASHLLYTQKGILDDTNKAERRKGMEGGFKIGRQLDKTVVYIDRGISNGMVEGMLEALTQGREIDIRSLQLPR